MASFSNALSGRLLFLFATIASVPAAIYMGRLAGQGNTGQVGLLLGAMFGMLILLAMGDKVWWVVPFTFALGLPPIPFGGRELNMAEIGTVGASAFFIARMLMHKQKVVLHRWENVSVFLYFAWVAMIYCMNPVGFSSMGAGALQ